MRYTHSIACLLLIVCCTSNVQAQESGFSFSGIWSKLWGSSKTKQVSKAQEDALYRRTAVGNQLTDAQQRTLRELDAGGQADLGRIKKMLGISEADMAKAKRQLDSQFGDPSNIDIDAIYRQHLKGKEGELQDLFGMLSNQKTFGSSANGFGGKKKSKQATSFPASSPISQEQLLKMLKR